MLSFVFQYAESFSECHNTASECDLGLSFPAMLEMVTFYCVFFNTKSSLCCFIVIKEPLNNFQSLVTNIAGTCSNVASILDCCGWVSMLGCGPPQQGAPVTAQAACPQNVSAQLSGRTWTAHSPRNTSDLLIWSYTNICVGIRKPNHHSETAAKVGSGRSKGTWGLGGGD